MLLPPLTFMISECWAIKWGRHQWVELNENFGSQSEYTIKGSPLAIPTQNIVCHTFFPAHQ